MSPLPPCGHIAVIGFLVTRDCQDNVSLNGKSLFHPIKWLEVDCFARIVCSQSSDFKSLTCILYSAQFCLCKHVKSHSFFPPVLIECLSCARFCAGTMPGPLTPRWGRGGGPHNHTTGIRFRPCVHGKLWGPGGGVLTPPWRGCTENAFLTHLGEGWS